VTTEERGAGVTAVDGSLEMLAVAAARAGGERVRFIQADLFTQDELVEGPSSSTIRRQIPDGTAYRLVKVPHQPDDLETRLGELGWDIKVAATAGPFYWGAGSRGKCPA
jgi:hypothetical protein